MDISSALDEKIRVWCLMRDQFSHVKPVEEYFGSQAEFIYDSEWIPEKMLLAKPDIIVCVNEYQYDIAKCISAAREHRIPSLLFQDGILEWRCQYENPLFGKGEGPPQHQPVLADKIACIGNQSARHIASWGNHNKTEITGMPRLDSLLSINVPIRPRPGRTLLVMSSKKPWFDDAQRFITLQSFMDIKEHLHDRPEINVIWRLTKDISRILGVENRLTHLSTQELSEVLGQTDAVITNISTSILEAMLLGRPVAILDFHNSPTFIQTAWSISTSSQIDSVLDEILDPHPTKMAFQQVSLLDSLFIKQSASSKVAELILRMIRFSRNPDNQFSSELKFPERMMGDENYLFYTNGGGVNLGNLYPTQKIFQNADIIYLQSLLVRADNENRKLQDQLTRRNLNYWIQVLVSYFYKMFTSFRQTKAIKKQ